MPRPGGGYRHHLRNRPWWLGVAVAVMGGVWLHGALSLPQGATYAVIGPGAFVALVAVGLTLGVVCWLLFSRLLGLSLPGILPALFG